MQESLRTIAQIANAKSFFHTPIVILFTHLDGFIAKVGSGAGSDNDINKAFEDYDLKPTATVEEKLNFIIGKFIDPAIYPNRSLPLAFSLNALDKEECFATFRKILKAIKKMK
jgi:hypothetical protein